MKKHVLPLLLAGVIASPIATAESELYVTGGVSSFDLGRATTTGATLRAGWRWQEHFGAELEGSFGLDSEALDVLGGDIKLDSQVGAYLVGRIPVDDKASVYGRVGYARTEVEFDYSGGDFIRTSDGIAFGFGGEYMFTDRLGIRGDFTSTDGEGGIGAGSIEAFSLSGVIKFGGPE